MARLHQLGSICGCAVDCFRSYPALNHSALLSHGVPQGSILGSVLFFFYLLPLGSIQRKCIISFHFYIDSQIYELLKKKYVRCALLNHFSSVLKTLKPGCAWTFKNLMKRKQRRWYLVPVALVESTLTHRRAQTHTRTHTVHPTLTLALWRIIWCQ